MKTIIALRGESNSGKTSSFVILARMMISNGFILREGNFLEKENQKRGRDFWQIFEKSNKKIGVVSSGDLYKIVRQQLDSLNQNHQCDIALCTCRSFDRSKSKPGTVAAIMETPGFEEPFIWKERALYDEKRNEENHASAKELMKRLNSHIL
jgi:hypothetical protein